MAKSKSNRAEEKKPYYEQVAEKLIKQLEEGTAPWQRPWEPGETFTPHNPISGTKYKGSNAVWLAMQGRSDPRWMTYKQAQSVEAQVMKGEKGTLIQYWKTHEEKIKTDENGNPVLDEKGEKKKLWVAIDQPRVFSAVVFNAEQIQGLPPLEKKKTTLAWERHERAEAIMTGSGAKIYHDQNDRAFYTTMRDSIHLPPREQFKSADRYYATALHELGHWTGHESRLNRDLTGRFGSESYAKEELRAEITSLMVGDETGVGHDPGQHASYVKSWIKVLKEDPKELFRAARDAEKIKDLVMSYERQRPLEMPQESAPIPAVKEQNEILSALKEKHAEYVNNGLKDSIGATALESWGNLEKAAESHGMKARLTWTKRDEGELGIPIAIKYEKDGVETSIQTALSLSSGVALTEVNGNRVPDTKHTISPEKQREDLAKAVAAISSSQTLEKTDTYTVHNPRTNEQQEFTDPHEAGAALFNVERSDKPGVIHSLKDGGSRIMASTEIHGKYENGTERFVKTLPNSHPGDSEFRAGYMEALEKSVNERLKSVDRKTTKNLDPALNDDLATLETARATDHAKILDSLKESLAKANPGYSSLESWENLEKAAKEHGLKARLAFTKDKDEFDPPVKIQYEKDGQLSAIETKLSPPDGKALTEVYGDRVPGTNFTSDQTWQRDALERAIVLEQQKAAQKAKITENKEVLAMLEQKHTQTGKSALTSWKNHQEIASENALNARLEWAKAPKENEPDVVLRYERLGQDKPIHTELDSRSGKTITKYDGERIAGTRPTTDRFNQEYSLLDAISKDKFAAKIESMASTINKERQEKAQNGHQAQVDTRNDTQNSIQLKLAEKLSKGFADDFQRAMFLQKVQTRLAEQEIAGNDIKIIQKKNKEKDDVER